jgi:V/A-type H+/Na+-transporting ATPase subunit G/H
LESARFTLITPLDYDFHILGNTISIERIFPRRPYGERHLSRAEILLQVKSAEEEAQQILKRARDEEKALASSARKEAVRRVQEAEERLQEEFNSALSAEKERVASLREELIGKGQAEASSIERMAEECVQRAKIHLKSLFERTVDVTTRIDD